MPEAEPERQAQVQFEENNPYSVTEDDLKEKLFQQNYGRVITQVYSGIMACLSAFTFGSAFGWSSPVGDQLLKKNKDFSWIPCLVPLGCCVGAIPWSYLMDTFGPRRMLLIASPLCVLAWMLLAFPVNNSATLQSVMRFFNGMFVISQRICGETLLVDTVHKSLVCRMYVCFQSTVYLGVSLVQFLGLMIKNEQLCGFCMIFPMAQFVMLYFAKESPAYLMKKNETLARKSLIWYRGEENIHEDMRLMKRDSEFHRLDVETYRYMIYAPVVKKALLIILGTFFFKMCTGYYILLMYSCGHIFYGVHIAKHPTELLALIGFTFYISNYICLTVHVHHQFAVRPPLIISCLGCGVCLSLIAWCMRYSDFIYKSMGWLPPVFGILLIFFADFGLNYIPKVLLLEYMPFQVYKIAATYSYVVQWFGIFLLLRIFEIFRSGGQTHVYVFFVILSSLCFIGSIFTYKFVVETKDKSLMRVQLDLGGNPVGTRGAHLTRFRIDAGYRMNTATRISGSDQARRSTTETV